MITTDQTEKSRQNIPPTYKVVILAAGRGVRLGDTSPYLHKALLPLGFKPVLSHILEKFPPTIEIIIAVGHKKEQIIDYLSLAYPERRFTFVEVDRYTGIGSGPGYSLLCCKKFLGNSPFIVTTVDTLVLEEIPPVMEDWLGVAPVSSTKRFNSVSLKDGYVANMQDKEECDNTHAFIGLCGIKNTPVFWQSFEKDTSVIHGELQLSNGLKALVGLGMKGVEFTWFDTGDTQHFERTQNALFPNSEDRFNFSKKDEEIYFVNDRIVKFFRDETISRCRVDRAKHLFGFVPEIEGHKNHFYSYKRICGKVMYTQPTPSLVTELLDWLQTSFWKRCVLNPSNLALFKATCKDFYFNKTMKRIEVYFSSTNQQDGESIVNGVAVPSLTDLLSQIPWEKFYEGIPGRIHGDLQFDNILVSEEGPSHFVLIDWRQDFGGLIDYGDIYYDLAKLYGGILIPYDLIKKGAFSYLPDGNRVTFSIKTRRSLMDSREIYRKKIEEYGYDFEKIKRLVALIFLNMAPLHHYPFNVLLHHLGKMEMFGCLKGQNHNNWLEEGWL